MAKKLAAENVSSVQLPHEATTFGKEPCFASLSVAEVFEAAAFVSDKDNAVNLH